MTNKEAIRRIKDHCEIHFKLERPNAIKITEALNMAIKALEQQEKDRWIPVSERLPSMEECQNNDCRFIVTDENRRYQDWFNYVDGYFESYNCDGEEFSLLRRDNLVIAWKPMPDPYMADET